MERYVNVHCVSSVLEACSSHVLRILINLQMHITNQKIVLSTIKV